MPEYLRTYSKWFRLLYWFFWPIGLISLFSFSSNIFTFSIMIMDSIYTLLLLTTFIIESLLHISNSR